MTQHAKVLIVEYDDSLREVLATFLEREGYGVDTASDGRAALDKFRREPYDVVVTSVIMPKIDGIELSSRIKKRFPKTSVILMSSDPRVKINALELEVSSFLQKPFLLEELSKSIKENLTSPPVQRLKY